MSVTVLIMSVDWPRTRSIAIRAVQNQQESEYSFGFSFFGGGKLGGPSPFVARIATVPLLKSRRKSLGPIISINNYSHRMRRYLYNDLDGVKGVCRYNS